MTTVELNKEIVDLLSKVKKHLRDKHQVAISLADPEVLNKLVALRELPDPLFQGMLHYLMALIGPEWSAKISSSPSTETVQSNSVSTTAKKFFSSYRGATVAATHDSQQNPPAGEAKKKPVRYYRGQPIYD